MTGDSLVRQPPETPRGLRRPGQRPAVSTTKPACLSHLIPPWKLHWACVQVIPVSPGPCICDFFSYYTFSSQEARFVCRQAEGKRPHKSCHLMDSLYLSKTQIGLCQACICPLDRSCRAHALDVQGCEAASMTPFKAKQVDTIVLLLTSLEGPATETTRLLSPSVCRLAKANSRTANSLHSLVLYRVRASHCKSMQRVFTAQSCPVECGSQ